MSPRARRLAPVVAALWLAAAPALAQVRGIEAEGAVPVPADAFTAAALRAEAQDAALREALIQVATQLATPPAPVTPPGGAAPGAPAPGTAPATPTGSAAPAPGADATSLADRVRKAFETVAPLDFTARYRVVQDVGVRPRQTLKDPTVSQEYAVRVEAQVDTARVRRKLGAAGLLPPPPKETGAAAASAPTSFGIVVEGLPSAGALADLERALLERARAKEVLPTSITAHEVALTVTAGPLGPDAGATLRGPIGSGLWLEAVPGGEPGAPLRLRVSEPPPLSAQGSLPPSAGAAATPGPGTPPPSAGSLPARPPVPATAAPGAGRAATAPPAPVPSPARD